MKYDSVARRRDQLLQSREPEITLVLKRKFIEAAGLDYHTESNDHHDIF